MKLSPTNQATTRIRIYGTLFVLLVVSRFLLPADAWQGNLTRHMALEFMAAMLAVFVGMLALVRYFTRRDNVFLFIGVGFVGAGLLDGLHVLAVHPQLMDIFPWLNFTPRWIWNASPTFLSILIFGSWLTWRREVETGWYGRMTGRRLFLLIVGLTLINVLLFALVAQSEAAPSLPLERVELFISTTFYLWALVNYLAKGHWQHDTFEHWLIIALLLSFSGQIFFLFSSVELFDAYFEVALALKLARLFLRAGRFDGQHRRHFPAGGRQRRPIAAGQRFFAAGDSRTPAGGTGGTRAAPVWPKRCAKWASPLAPRWTLTNYWSVCWTRSPMLCLMIRPTSCCCAARKWILSVRGDTAVPRPRSSTTLP
jgi:hypothetical protein